MGNRAVITWSKDEDVSKSNDVGIYLHWNGGRDSVEAFLKYCELHGYREPDKDCYGYARLCQTIANFFGGDGLSIGIDRCCTLDCDNYDNGVYICEGWNIVGRQFNDYGEQQEYDLVEMVDYIDSCQPKNTRLGSVEIAKRLGGDNVKFYDINITFANQNECDEWEQENIVDKKYKGETVLMIMHDEEVGKDEVTITQIVTV